MSVFTKSLPVDTTSRLRAVAEILRTKPERWDQNTWMSAPPDQALFDLSPLEAVMGFGPVDCGTNHACVAGWGLLLTPMDQLGELPNVTLLDGWQDAAAATLGLQATQYEDNNWHTLAERLFSQDVTLNGHELADVLDKLADIPENERTWETFAFRWPSLADALP